MDCKERVARSSVASTVDVKPVTKPSVKPLTKQEVKPDPKVKQSPFKPEIKKSTSPPKEKQENAIKLEPATPSKASSPKKVFSLNYLFCNVY